VRDGADFRVVFGAETWPVMGMKRVSGFKMGNRSTWFSLGGFLLHGKSFNMCEVGSEILAWTDGAGTLEGNHGRKNG
jgi:hypothetical protein